MPWQSAPICGPALSARASSCCVPSGVRRGRSSSWMRWRPRCLAQVLAQQLAGLRIEQADVLTIPLHLHAPADPARRRAVVGGFDFHAAVQMNRALAVLVIAERLERQRQQRGFLFGEHGRDLPFGGAVNARVGPALFPVIQVGLRFFQTFEALPFERRFLGVADAGLDLALSIRIAHAARQRDGAVVRQHVAVQRIERGIVDVGREHAFAQIVEDDDAVAPPSRRKACLVQFGPDLRTGAEASAAGRTCGCSRASARTAACGDTCRSADRGPSGPSP